MVELCGDPIQRRNRNNLFTSVLCPPPPLDLRVRLTSGHVQRSGDRHANMRDGASATGLEQNKGRKRNVSKTILYTEANPNGAIVTRATPRRAVPSRAAALGEKMPRMAWAYGRDASKRRGARQSRGDIGAHQQAYLQAIGSETIQ